MLKTMEEEEIEHQIKLKEKEQKRREKIKKGMNKEEKKKLILKNCEMEFECPLLWDNLEKTNKENKRYCSECKEKVYHCKTETELKKYTEKGKCVFFEIEDIVGNLDHPKMIKKWEKMGKMSKN
jgi:hypothetical protein